MKRIRVVAAGLLGLTIGLAGCSSFKLGSVVYIPYGQTGKFEAGAVTAADEAVKAVPLIDPVVAPLPLTGSSAPRSRCYPFTC